MFGSGMKHAGQRTGRAALVSAAVAASLLLAGCGRRETAAADADPTRNLYRRHCAACHGPDGAGGQVGALRVPSLKEKAALAYTDEQLFEQIYKGRGGMPPFHYTLTDEQIRQLARFVREDIQGRR
ncbi:MAG: cytochrome c [Acidobacteriota bacterium]|nr:cytochrome c [Acidobacteriota bacterium]